MFEKVCPALTQPRLAPAAVPRTRTRTSTFRHPLNGTSVQQSLPYSTAGSVNNGDCNSPISSLGKGSAKYVVGFSGLVTSRSQGSIGSEERELECGDIQHRKGVNEGREEALDHGFDQPMRLEILRGLVRDSGAAPTPDNLPQAVRDHAM